MSDSNPNPLFLGPQLTNRTRVFLKATGLTERQFANLIRVDPANPNAFFGRL
jgi:hypothetical protein